MADIVKKVKEGVKKLFPKSEEATKKEEEIKEENLDVQFELGELKEKEICDTIELMVSDDKASRVDFMAVRQECVKLYEGIREPKNKPWPNCSNISTMVTTVSCDLLHAKLFPMIWNPETMYWEGRENHDEEVAENIQAIMSWVVGPSEMKLEPTIDDILHCLVVDGTVVAKKAWRTYWTYVTRLEPLPMSPDSIISGELKHEVVYDYIPREKCYVELKSLDRVFFPYEGGSDENELDHIIEEVWYTLADLREMQADGLIPKRIKIDDLVADMDKLEEFSGPSLERMQAEGTTPVNTRKEAYKIKCYEAYMKYAVGDDVRRNQCVFLMAAKPKKYLAGKPLHAVSRIGKRPWIIRPFLRRPGRTVGKSVPELTRWLHKEMDAIHNQRIDAGNMSIAPYFFYRAHSGTQPKTITVGPATGVPLDDPQRDVTFPTFPNYGLQVSFQEERIVMEMIERLTFLTPAMLGKELASRPTVRGTLAVMSQGEQKFGLLARRVQHIISDLLTSVKQSYEENMPPDLQARILGKKGNPIFANLSPENIAGQYDCKMQLDLTAGNIGMEREINTIVMQTMAFDPFVQQNPAYGWEIRKDYLTSLNKKNVERFIGPKPPTEMEGKDAEDIFFEIQQENDVHPPLNINMEVISRLLEIRGSKAYESLTEEAKLIFARYVREAKLAYSEAMRERMANYVEANGRVGFEEGIGGIGGFGQAPGVGGSPGAGSPGPAQPGGGRGVQVGGAPPPRE